MLQVFQKTLSLFIPPLCPVCEENLIDPSREIVCKSCFHKLSLNFVDNGHVKWAGTMPVYYSLVYSDVVKRMIQLFKFENFESIGRFLARAMMNKLQEDDVHFDSITYIPSHPARIREKGSYPTKFLARELSHLSGKPVLTILRAVRYRKSQTSAQDREKNVKGAFEVIENMKSEGTILIVDDVITTGSTMAEAAKVLKEAGYEKMVGVAAAGKP